MKKKDKSSYFPSISRFITDLPAIATLRRLQAGKKKYLKKNQKLSKEVLKNLKVYFLIFCYLFLISLILFLIIDFKFSNDKKEKLLLEQKETTSELKKFENLNLKFQGSKDIYLELASLEYKLGDFEKAKFYIQEALLLDPNFTDAMSLKRILDKIQ